MIERLPYLAVALLSLIFFGVGMWYRASRQRVGDRPFALKLAWTSFGLASSLAGAIFPSAWLFVSFIIYGGTFESNLPVGYSPPFMLAAILAGMWFTGLSTVYGYIEHLRS